MADASGPSGGGYDYVQDSTGSPTNPKNGEEWYQPDTEDAKTYDGGEWVDMKISDHDQLSSVDPADHHAPVTVGAPITRSRQVLALAYANALTLDGSDQLAVDESAIALSNLSGYPIGTSDLGFDTATQSELDGHAGDSTNPHNVTDDQTGAASALSNHAGDSAAHHDPPMSRTDDGSDITTYRVNDNYTSGSITVCDITGSGALLGGHAIGTASSGTSDTISVTLTVDGGSSYTIDGVITRDSSDDYYHTAVGFPTVEFDASLKIVVNAATSGILSGHAMVKEW